jgi:hypothetical protein
MCCIWIDCAPGPERDARAVLEDQGEIDRVTRLQRLFEADQHDVQAAGLQGDRLPGGNLDLLDSAHAHHTAFFDVGVQLDDLRDSAFGTDQGLRLSGLVFQGHEDGAVRLAGRHSTGVGIADRDLCA